ncbi:MAG: zinc ribbon domain-containing protein [Lachnospiraceae bacterium]|nr:zinc ribbon domain-containing protein [Lachnospiraceae bacterium]
MICRNCGATLPDDSMFCEKCGSRIDQMNQQAPQMQPVQPQPQMQPVQPQPQMQQTQQMPQMQAPYQQPMQQMPYQQAQMQAPYQQTVQRAPRQKMKLSRLLIIICSAVASLLLIGTIVFLSVDKKSCDAKNAEIEAQIAELEQEMAD